ncbi:PH domain-containing protein [Actinomycetospora sp. C-140]
MTDDAGAVTWAAPWPAVLLGLAGTVGFGAWALAVGDPPGRLLVGIAAVAVGVVTAVGAFARPRLRVDDGGLVLRGLTGTRRWPWERVDAVRVVRMRRLGVPAAYLEVETRDGDAPDDGRLLVLGRLELGTDPVEVAEALQEHRARAGRAARTPASGQREDPDRDEHDQDDGDPADGEESGGRP